VGASTACLLSLACSPEPQELTEEQERRVVEIGRESAGELGSTLMSQLSEAMQLGGPARAVEFCSSTALDLTDSVAQHLGRGISLKRTTFKYRNPGNAPDEFDIAALQFFEGAPEGGGDLPSHYLQRAPGGVLRYYQPLVVNEFCLQCHGASERIDPAVRRQLAERYPADQATGYSVGNFRGVIRVSVPANLIGG
jgi:hypothetical protein